VIINQLSDHSSNSSRIRTQSTYLRLPEHVVEYLLPEHLREYLCEKSTYLPYHHVGEYLLPEHVVDYLLPEHIRECLCDISTLSPS
jgi:hypothetical protein